MDITSCSRCGVVLDRDNMGEFPNPYYEGQDEADTAISEWSESRSEHVGFLECPVCENHILERD